MKPEKRQSGKHSVWLNLALLLVKAVTLQRNVNSSAERNYFPHLTSASSKDDFPYKAPLLLFFSPAMLQNCYFLLIIKTVVGCAKVPFWYFIYAHLCAKKKAFICNPIEIEVKMQRQSRGIRKYSQSDCHLIWHARSFFLSHREYTGAQRWLEWQRGCAKNTEKWISPFAAFLWQQGLKNLPLKLHLGK